MKSFATEKEIEYAHRMLLPGKDFFGEDILEVIQANSSCDVKASPGSGKTTALLAKLAILSKRLPFADGSGVCVLTHTNVAIDEIRSKLSNQSDILFSYPNFFGTIQSFVDKFLTIPYFNSVMDVPINVVEDDRAIKIIKDATLKAAFEERKGLYRQIKDRLGSGKPAGMSKSKYAEILESEFVANTYYSRFNKKFYRNYGDSRALASEGAKLFSLLYKTRLVGILQGVLKYDDTYSFAFTYLEQNPHLKEIIANRFTYVFIDEMQDCQQIQTDLLDKLFDPEKVIIQRFGDPYQSIYDLKIEGEHWKLSNNTLPLNVSRRFGENIAKVLRTVCVTDNSSLVANETVPSLKPIMLVYKDCQKVLPKFVELLKTRKLGDKTILEIAQDIQHNDVLHRNRIKAIGWVKNNKKGTTSISSYFPNFESVQGTSGKKYSDKLIDYIDLKSVDYKVISDSILDGISEALNVCGITYKENGRNIRFSRSRLIKFLKLNHEEEYNNLRVKSYQWCTKLVSFDKDGLSSIHEEIKKYTEELLYNYFALKNLPAAFDSYMHFEKNEDIIEIRCPNVYTYDGVDVEVASVHAVKGETHVATLYMETCFNRKHESEYFPNQLKGIPYNKTIGETYTRSALKVAYVGFSRPQYLLCFAIEKSRFDKINCETLRALWDIVTV